MEDFVFGDVGVAFGGCRGEDAVAFVERLERFRFGSLVDGFDRVEGRVVFREGGCDLGVSK